MMWLVTVMGIAGELERGRQLHATRAGRSAYTALSTAGRKAPLGPSDLELLATAAYMIGRDGDYLGALERAHHAHLAAGDALGAARCAFWVGVNLATRGEMGPATGWLGRAQRLVELEQRDCVEQGYLLLPLVLRHAAGGDWEAASTAAAAAADGAQRFHDADLFALAVQEQGGALVRQGRVEEGLRSLD